MLERSKHKLVPTDTQRSRFSVNRFQQGRRQMHTRRHEYICDYTRTPRSYKPRPRWNVAGPVHLVEWTLLILRERGSLRV